jgi:hypothetical protein
MTVTGRRGARPKKRKIPESKADRKALAVFEEELGCKLHPLARRMPAPSEADVVTAEERMGRDWIGAVSYVDDPRDGELLLGGVENLLAWRREGKRKGEVIATFPAACTRRVGPEDAVELLLKEHVGARADWTESRRATAAALFVNEVSTNLPKFQKAAGLDGEDGRKKTTACVLGVLSHTSGPTIENALWAMDNRCHAFREVLFVRDRPGDEGRRNGVYLPTRPAILSKTPGHGSRTSKCDVTPIDPADPDALAPENRAHLAIVERSGLGPSVEAQSDYSAPSQRSSFKPWTQDLWARLDPTAVIAYICDLSLEQMHSTDFPRTVTAELTQSSHPDRKAPRIYLHGGSLVPIEVREAPLGGFDATWRIVLFFTFSADVREGGFPAIPMPDLSYPKSKQACRVWMYEDLMRAYCRQGTNRVFGPYFDGHENAEEEMILQCLKTACSRCAASLIAYQWGVPVR